MRRRIRRCHQAHRRGRCPHRRTATRTCLAPRHPPHLCPPVSFAGPHPARAREHPGGTGTAEDIVFRPAEDGGIPVARKRHGKPLRCAKRADRAGADQLRALLTELRLCRRSRILCVRARSRREDRRPKGEYDWEEGCWFCHDFPPFNGHRWCEPFRLRIFGPTTAGLSNATESTRVWRVFDPINPTYEGNSSVPHVFLGGILVSITTRRAVWPGGASALAVFTVLAKNYSAGDVACSPKIQAPRSSGAKLIAGRRFTRRRRRRGAGEAARRTIPSNDVSGSSRRVRQSR